MLLRLVGVFAFHPLGSESQCGPVWVALCRNPLSCKGKCRFVNAVVSISGAQGPSPGLGRRACWAATQRAHLSGRIDKRLLSAGGGGGGLGAFTCE